MTAALASVALHSRAGDRSPCISCVAHPAAVCMVTGPPTGMWWCERGRRAGDRSPYISDRDGAFADNGRRRARPREGPGGTQHRIPQVAPAAAVSDRGGPGVSPGQPRSGAGLPALASHATRCSVGSAVGNRPGGRGLSATSFRCRTARAGFCRTPGCRRHPACAALATFGRTCQGGASALGMPTHDTWHGTRSPNRLPTLSGQSGRMSGTARRTKHSLRVIPVSFPRLPPLPTPECDWRRAVRPGTNPRDDPHPPFPPTAVPCRYQRLDVGTCTSAAVITRAPARVPRNSPPPSYG